MKEKTEWRIVAVAAAILILVMVAFGVHQYIELKHLDSVGTGAITELEQYDEVLDY